MKTLRIGFIALLASAFLAGSVAAQKKTTTKKTTSKKPAATTTAKTLPPLEVRAAREKVTIQLDNLNLFIARFGPIAQTIEDFEISAKTKTPNAKSAELNAANKQKVVEAIRNLKAGLDTLETEFRTKPDLKKYLANIDGISSLAAQAEDSAIAGKFVVSKEPLRTAAQRMADTLAVMPKASI